MRIKTFSANEEAICNDFWCAYNEDDPSLINDALMASNWRKIQSTESSLHAYWLQTDKGQPAGFINFLHYESTASENGRYYIQNLFVYPDHRRQGYAKALIDAVFDHARERGIENVYWITRDHNKNAQALYDKIAIKTDWVQYEVTLDDKKA